MRGIFSFRMAGFESCRFDFKLDSKNGLTPAKRKKTEKKIHLYNTFFKCKQCSQLFDSRSALLAHKMDHVTGAFICPFCSHKEATKQQIQEHLTSKHGVSVQKPIEMPDEEEVSPPKQPRKTASNEEEESVMVRIFY